MKHDETTKDFRDFLILLVTGTQLPFHRVDADRQVINEETLLLDALSQGQDPCIGKKEFSLHLVLTLTTTIDASVEGLLV